MEHKLIYHRPAEYFEEALPLGNGTMGAMVYGGTVRERISLNHESLWSGKPRTHLRPNAKEAYLQARELIAKGDTKGATELLEREFTAPFGETYLPLGNLWMETEAEGEIPPSLPPS